ncbi:hypothetical protein AAG570_002811, partial [Ranatra chinensis]
SFQDDILNLKLGSEGYHVDELIDICKNVVRYSVKTGHPFFLNQLYRGVDPYALAGVYISEALNTNQYTYEVAPVFTLCEMEVIRRAQDLFGFRTGDGIFAPGGSISNMYGIVLARFNKFPEVKRKGLSSIPPLVLFTSQDVIMVYILKFNPIAHYSVIKSANWLGIGTDNVVAVQTDEKGCMIPNELVKSVKKAINEGKVPLMVNATAGTTVLGAFDPFNEIADICKKYGLWMHVDACWGGSLIFSKNHFDILDGIQRADSMSWNPHKMLGAPLQCSMFLVKKKGLLYESNAANAAYLFQKDKMYDTQYDTGDKSVQCGRKVDAFKLWLMWKARGDEGFGELVDQAVHCSRYFLEKIKFRPGFKVVLPEYQCTNISFWYIPSRLREVPETYEWWEEIDKVIPKLKEKLVLAGSMIIAYQPLVHKNVKNFLRLAITCHPPATEEEMDYIISEIDKHGKEL